jgi:hypothetical protein
VYIFVIDTSLQGCSTPVSAVAASDRSRYQLVEREAAGSTVPIEHSSTSDEVVIRNAQLADGAKDVAGKGEIKDVSPVEALASLVIRPISSLN